MDPRDLALDLARAQCSPAGIVAALKRRAGMTKADADRLVAELEEELADAALDGQCEVLERLWSISRGHEGGKGQTTLQELAYQYCGWTRGGVDEAMRKHMEAATRDQFRKHKLRVA